MRAVLFKRQAVQCEGELNLNFLNVIPLQGAPAYGESSPQRHVGQAVGKHTYLERLH